MSCCYEHHLGDETEEAECERCGADIVVITSWKAGWLEPTPRHDYRCEECGGPWERRGPPSEEWEEAQLQMAQHEKRWREEHGIWAKDAY